MNDLISRQAAIDLFPNDALEWDTNGGYIAPHLARQMIEELPSVQPVKHGAWLPCDKKGYILTEVELRDGRRWYGYKCSECNNIYHGNTFTKYCSTCGAKMDLERKEE